MPALTIDTSDAVRARSPSPTRPPISPITPPLGPTRLPGTDQPPRQTFTHSQPDQVGTRAPAPEPISLDSNPDAIALRSAIAVLQMQRRRAADDIRELDRVKNEAVQEAESFVNDLKDGKVNKPASSMTRLDAANETGDSDGDDAPAGPSSEQGGTNHSWASIPRPQQIVRCPPINWSQYAVVGESLDKLHAEQVTRPSQGTPAVFSANGTYQFKGEGKQEPYLGAAAPYAPGRDRIDKKPKSKK